MYVTKFVLFICAFSVIIGKSEGFNLWAAFKKYLDIIYGAVTFRKLRLTGHLHKIDSDEEFYKLYNRAFDEKQNKNARNQVLVVQFSTPTCPPCNALTPFMEEYARRYTDVVFMKVDITKAVNFAAENLIQNVPKTFFLKRKQVAFSIEGNKPQEIKTQIERFSTKVKKV